MGTEKRININLSEELHKQLKLVCVLKNTGLKNYIHAALTEAIKANKKVLDDIKRI